MGNLSKHFSDYEFACQCGCGFNDIASRLVEALEDVREHFGGRRIVVNSGCRCASHNAKVGGSAASRHVKGDACDFWINEVHPDDVTEYLENKYHDTCGIGKYHGRTHLDMRSNHARWDKR